MLHSFITAPGWFQKIVLVILVGLLGVTFQVLWQHTKDTAVGWEGRVDTVEKSLSSQKERLATVESTLSTLTKGQERIEDRVELIYQHLLGQRKK